MRKPSEADADWLEAQPFLFAFRLLEADALSLSEMKVWFAHVRIAVGSG